MKQVYKNSQKLNQDQTQLKPQTFSSKLIITSLKKWSIAVALFQLALFSATSMVSLDDSSAMSIKAKTLRAKARFLPEDDSDLFRPLDLIAKKVRFSHRDKKHCSQRLNRMEDELVFSCTLSLKSKADIGILRRHLSPKQIRIKYGNSIKTVYIKVSEDAKRVTFSIEFDKTGIDLEFQEFNDDFFTVFEKMASVIIGKAMSKIPLNIKVLETT